MQFSASYIGSTASQMAQENGSEFQDNSFPRILLHKLHCSPRAMCLTSKPVTVLLVWVFVVASLFVCVQYGVALALPAADHGYNPAKLSFIYFTCFYAFMAVITTCYPVSGFIADVYCGRYRMVTASMGFLWATVIMLVIAVIIKLSTPHAPHQLNVFIGVLVIGAFLVSIPGLSGFYSNMIQLGLDQLQDAPSRTLGIFLHWAVWVDLLGKTISHIVFVTTVCSTLGFGDSIKIVGYSLSGVFFTLLSILLAISCCTKRWFIATDVYYNPYKMVFNVLRYVRTHKHPTRHSALHWTNGEKPSRFDFAKNCYGGPFTSGQVEDVKTLCRVVIVLITIGPVFFLSVPTSYFLFPLFSFHVSGRNEEKCTYEWIFVKSGTLSYLVGLVCLPTLTWVIYCVLRNRVPKIFTRLEIGMIFSILGVSSMLIIDIIGHNLTSDSTNSTGTHCMFLESYNLNREDNKHYYTLNLPWYVLIVPNLLSTLSESIVIVTTFEFISAQTPQAMKGLMFGAFFAIKGSYSFLAAISLIPFSLKYWEASPYPYLSCGFSYFFTTLFVSLVGLAMFACIRRRYKYRMRDEEPFPQAVIEEIYERRLQHVDTDDNSVLDSPEIVPGSIERRSGDNVNTFAAQKNVRFRESEEDSVISAHVSCAGGTGFDHDRLLSKSHDWYGTFKCKDSAKA